MAVFAVEDASAGIQSLTMNAANGGGDSVAGGTKLGGWELPVVIVVRNTDAATKTVTVAGVGYVVPATTGIALIPIRGTAKYGDSVAITYSAVTGVTVGVGRLSSPLG